MGKFRRGVIFLALLALGGSAILAQLWERNAPRALFDAVAWTSWWSADPEKNSALLIASILGGVGAIGALLFFFMPSPIAKKHLHTALEPIATKNDLAQLATKSDIALIKAQLLAALGSQRPLGDHSLYLDISAAQSDAITRILTSQEAVDANVRKALESSDIDGTVSALLSVDSTDRKLAAARSREAGILTFRRNTTKAIEAFERARKLDPGDFWDHVFLSWLYLSAGNVVEAETLAYASLQVASGSRQHAIATTTIADVLFERGNTEEARQRLVEALGIAHERTAICPDDYDWLCYRTVILHKLGHDQEARGDLAGALVSFQEMLDVARHLQELSVVEDPAVQLGISQSLSDIGGALRKRGKLNDATRLLCEALAILERLTKINPSDIQTRQQIISVARNIGDIALVCGRSDSALQHYRVALSTSRELADLDPSNIWAQRELGWSLNQMAAAMNSIGDFEAADKLIYEGLITTSKIAIENPHDSRIARDVVISLNKKGNLLLSQGNAERALQCFREMERLCRRKFVSDPNNDQAQRDLSISLNKIGAAMQMEGNLGGAAAALSESLVIDRGRASAVSRSAEAERDLCVTLCKLSEVRMHSGDLGTSAELIREGLRRCRKLVKVSPESDQAISDVFVMVQKAGELFRIYAAGKPNHVATDKGAEPIQQPTETKSGCVQAHVDSGTCLMKIGDLAMDIQDRATASKCFEEALTTFMTAAHLAPEHELVKLYADRARDALGRAEEDGASDGPLQEAFEALLDVQRQ